MNNSGASESTEIAHEASNTQHTSGVATSKGNYDQTVHDIENQNMQVAVEVEQPIVIGTSFNQQQDPVQDIENPNLEEFDGAPPNFVQQQHIVEDIDPNQNRKEQSGGGINNSGASESTEITSHVSNTQHTKGVSTSERNNDQTIQDIENQNMQVSVEVDPPIVIGTSFKQHHHTVEDIESPNLEEFDGAPPNFVQQHHTVEDNDPNQNFEGVAAASLSLIPQLPDTIQDNGSQTSEPNTIQEDESQTSEAKDVESMYRAALEGNWANAEKLLEKDPTLAFKGRNGYHPNNETEEKFYGPLHVAVALKHDKFVLNLIERTEPPRELNLLNSDRQTACSYAAALGKLDIIKAMIKRHPNVLEECVETCAGLTFFATFSGKSEVISFFLERTHEVGDSWKEGWLALLENTIGAKMYGVALRVIDKDDSVATKSNGKGTGLHFLARQDISAASTAKTTMIFRSIFGTTIKETRTMAMSFIWKIYNKFYIKFNNKDVNIYDSAKLGPRKIAIPALQMQNELAWFKAVEAMSKLELIDRENKDGKTPRALFDETHKKLFEESKEWMKSTANSCMLIATIILTVVYAAAFTVPGGSSEATGLPILVKSNWLTCFFIFEALALFCSTLCIITFWSITCSGFVQDQFLYVLPYQLRLGFTALFGSLIGAISAFLSAYHIVLVEGKAWLVKSCLLSIYVLLVLAICGRFIELWNKTKLPECLPQMM